MCLARQSEEILQNYYCYRDYSHSTPAHRTSPVLCGPPVVLYAIFQTLRLLANSPMMLLVL